MPEKKEHKGKKPLEWLKQADYDIQSARVMLDNKRYIHAVFMCHLAIEKALKGLYAQKTAESPPKTHNLVFLIEKIGLELSEEMYDFVFTLNGVSVPTRYPDELKRMQKEYNKAKTSALFRESVETLRWLKARSEK